MEQVLIIIAVVVGVGGGALAVPLIVRSRSRPVPPPDRPSGAGRPGGTATLEAPPAAGPGVAAEPAASPGAPPAPPAPLVPPAEKPPPSAGRMVALRGRLARSQSALGSVLLSLLSSDRLDEQSWEEIEDTLITADMGVGPARQLVEQLRTEVKVGGTRDAAELRALLRADLIAQIGPDM